jgi:hypothetical protein
MDLDGQIMSAGQARTGSDSLLLSGPTGGADAPDRKADTKGVTPRRGVPLTVRPVRASSAGPPRHIQTADKTTCPDKPDKLAGPSRRSEHHGATEASVVCNAESYNQGVGQPPAAPIHDVEAADPSNPDSSPAAPALALLKMSATVSDDGVVQLGAEQHPGAMRTVLGARHDVDKPEPAAFASQAIYDLLQVTLADSSGNKLLPGPVSVTPLNAMLEAVAAFAPADELEGMIAIQAAVFHRIALDLLARGARSQRPEIRSANIGQANKCARTFAVLLDALNRHRGKVTTQKVIVENVTVEAGGQAVVGAVAGVGGAKQSKDQAHATNAADQDRGGSRPALPSPNASRTAVHVGGGEGQEALPDARGSGRKRRPGGQSQQPKARPLQRRRNRSAPDDPDASPRGAPALRIGALNGID